MENKTDFERPISMLEHLIEACNLDNEFNLLPICHTTSLEGLREMLNTNQLAPYAYDEAFQEDLLFFFYGRARYIPQEAVKDVYSRANPPIAFLYDLEKLTTFPKRLVAFDSGGFKRFAIDRPLTDFAVLLSTKSEEIKKYIKQLYSGNSNYLSKTLTINSAHYPLCTPLEWLRTLYSGLDDIEEKGYGEQAYTAEIHYNRGIDLKPTMVILPAKFGASDEAIQQTKLAFGIDDNDLKKKIIFYNDKGTSIQSYFYIVEEVKRQMEALIEK